MVIHISAKPEPKAPSSIEADKARQILDGARRVFMVEGFDGASMNDIARAAGVSKGTIYFHFESKEALFEALIRDERKQQAEQCCEFDEESEDVAGALTFLARSLLTFMIMPENIAQVRTVIAVAAKFPRIGQAFYETGPKYAQDRVSAYFAKQTAAGRLNTPDPEIAALHLLELCLGAHKRLMFCPDETISQKDIDRTVNAGVSVFMRAYGAGA